MRKPILKGDIEDLKHYWHSTFTGIRTSNLSLDDASSIICTRQLPEDTGLKELEYRDILNNQKQGPSHNIKEAARYHMALVFDTEKDDGVEKLEREFTGMCKSEKIPLQFVLIDRSSHYEAFPLYDFVTFNVHIPLSGIQGRAPGQILVAASTGDIKTIEKEMASWQKKELKIDQKAQNFTKRAMSAVDVTGSYLNESNKQKDMTYETDTNVIQNNWNENKKKKDRVNMKRKVRGNWHDERKDWGESALNVGQIKKSEHDWDFDGGENATDDEDVVEVPEEIVNDVDEYVGEEVQDSSDSEVQETLDKGGQTIQDALENAVELEADAELAQFSDSADSEEQAQATNKADAAGGAGTTTTNEAPKVTTSTTPSNTQARDPLQQRIIGILHRNSNIMSTQEFVSKHMKKKGSKDAEFLAIKKIIREICEVVKRNDPSSGKSMNYLQLKAMYRV